MPDAIFFVICFKRKNPVFTPDKVVYLCYDVCAYIGYNITLALDVHQQPYHESCNQGIERSYYCKKRIIRTDSFIRLLSCLFP